MQRKLKLALCIFLAIFTLLCTASALDVYVSNAGDDTAAGTADAPVATLTQAYALLGTDNGKILLADAVPVTATSGDCFIEPTHSAKITVTSAPDASGALDLTDIAHFHFGGETEWNNIGIIANELVLTADNHTVTMGEGLTVSSPSAATEFRGGHRFCGAKLHLTAYCPCETADVGITAAGGRLNVCSGEYRSISARYGEAMAMSGGKTEVILDTQNPDDRIWIRYLCPGLFGVLPDGALTASDSLTVTLVVGSGVNTVETYRTTQNVLSGNLVVNWLLRGSVQGDATAVTAWDCAFADGAGCAVKVYADENNAAANASAELLLRNAPSIGTYTLHALEEYPHTHEIYTAPDGRLLCRFCEYEQCRHRTSEAYVLDESSCTTSGHTRLKCTDLCGEFLTTVEEALPLNPNNHDGNCIKTTYDPARNRMAHRCSGCNALLVMQSGQPAETVYVGRKTGTPISIVNIKEHYAKRSVPVGSSPLYPFANFEDAMYYAAKAAAVHGSATVCILDDAYVPASYSTPSTSGTITITGGTLHFDTEARYFKLYGDIVFEHITFKTDPPSGSSSGKLVIMARNHRLVMGEGIVMGNENTVNTEYGFPPCNGVKMYVIGGFINPSNITMNTNITIRSGDYWYVGGWNMGSNGADGTSHITVGKTDPNDKLQIFYLCPFSHGNGCITQPAKSTMVFDGEASIKRLYVTTLNQASLDVEYVTNVVLRGDISGYNYENTPLQYDIRGTADNGGYPQTTVNLYTDSRVAAAVEDSYAFLGHPDEEYSRDTTLGRISAAVNAYSYEDYCQAYLGGHIDADADSMCDECGHTTE